MRLFIQVLDDKNNCRLYERIVVDDELFLPPNSDVVTLEGVKTAIDYYLYQDKKA